MSDQDSPGLSACRNKVLCLGMPRTGNYSLGEALRILGYTTGHAPCTVRDIPNADAWTEVYFSPRALDLFFPDSKFILTVRDLAGWLRSVHAFAPNVHPDWNPFWFVDPVRWPWMYHERVNDVLLHFGSSPRLLIMNICDGKDGWKPLCRFLRKPVPDAPFPHLNKSGG